MISTPVFTFGTPMYYTYPNYYSVVSNSIYQNDNGQVVRNFYVKDTAGYINPFFAMFGMRRAFALNYAVRNRGGGGYSSQTEKTEKPQTHNHVTQKEKPEKVTNSTVTKPIKTQKPEVQTQTQTSNNFGKSLVDIARKYSSCKEENGTHHKFCINPTCKEEDPYDQEWCTDFVTYVVKEAYENKGMKVPEGFGDHDVETLKNWAIKNDMFIKTANKARKASFITQNIKPGDIFIMNEGGASHTGFVTEIDKQTGVIHTIEGNRDDMVKEYKYSPDNEDLSGFIRLKP